VKGKEKRENNIVKVGQKLKVGKAKKRASTMIQDGKELMKKGRLNILSKEGLNRNEL